jgi:hypothetical protein
MSGGRLIDARGNGKPIRPSRLGLEISRQTSLEDWAQIGVRIANYADSSSWWLGDWLVFGERRYGQRYREAISATGLEYKTLRNYAVVARRFEMSRRRDTLSFAHHAEVCALPDADQDRWLDFAQEARWSRSELRRQLRASSSGSSAQGVAWLRVTVAPVHTERWRRAAERAGYELHEWVIHTLDAAAQTIGRTSSDQP